MTDFGWVGNKYTWCNRHEDGTFIREMLDRAMANHTWLNMYVEVKVEVMVALCFERCPLLINCWKENIREGIRRSRQFKYDIS